MQHFFVLPSYSIIFFDLYGYSGQKHAKVVVANCFVLNHLGVKVLLQATTQRLYNCF